MILVVVASSKNRNSLKIFVNFIQNILKSNRLYFNSPIIRQTNHNEKLKYYSILKSPHVYKKAQRQIGFKTTTISWKFRVNTRFMNQIITILKKILQINFKDLNVNLEFNLTRSDNNKRLKIFDPDYLCLNNYSHKISYIRLLDIYGYKLFQTRII